MNGVFSIVSPYLSFRIRFKILFFLLSRDLLTSFSPFSHISFFFSTAVRVFYAFSPTAVSR